MAASMRRMSSLTSDLSPCVYQTVRLLGQKSTGSVSKLSWDLIFGSRNERQICFSAKRTLSSGYLTLQKQQQQQHNFKRGVLAKKAYHTGSSISGLPIMGTVKTFTSSDWSRVNPVQGHFNKRNALLSLNQIRTFTNDNDEGDARRNGRRTMKLMDFPEIVWPSPLRTLRNQFFSFLIKTYFDKTFSLPGFLAGAVQAIEMVSACISLGNFDSLEGMVSYEAVQEIQNNFADLNVEQKKQISVKACDIYFKFVYEIGMIFDDDTNQRFVEITVVFQGFPGFDDLSNQEGQQYYEHVMDHQKDVYVCNYRFIREFTKGVESDWTINKLNHFSPVNLPVKF